MYQVVTVPRWVLKNNSLKIRLCVLYNKDENIEILLKLPLLVILKCFVLNYFKIAHFLYLMTFFFPQQPSLTCPQNTATTIRIFFFSILFHVHSTLVKHLYSL